MKTTTPKQAARPATVPLSEKLRYTRWKANRPVTKKLGLDDDGNLVKLSTAAQLYEGNVFPTSATPQEFVGALVQIGANDCLSYGIPTDSNVHRVLSREKFAAEGEPVTAMTRTADKLVWPSGPGILMLDYDPFGDVVLTREQFLEAIYSVCPELRDCAHVWAASTSSCLWNSETDTEVRGVYGQRLYVMLAHGNDIPRAGRVLFQKLWITGFGHIKVSAAGSLLVRSIVDDCVWQTNRIDYIAPPICEPPLVSRKPAPELLGNADHCLDTAVALPDLSPAEAASYANLVLSAKAAKESEARQVREQYIEKRVAKLVEEGVPRAEAQATIRAALETSVLHAGFVLEQTDGTRVTVGDLLANKAKYHDATFADPLEPDYHGDKRIARAKLLGVAVPHIHSFAHGGHTYRLAFQRETIRVPKGHRGEYIPKITAVLDTHDLVFARGSSLIGIGIDGRVAVKNKHGLTALMDQSIYFEHLTRNGWEPTDAKPNWGELMVAGYLDRFREVGAVLTAPCIVPTTGRILSTSGYDAEQHVFVLNADQFKPIPPEPTADDVSAALAALWLPVSQFPYCEPIDQSVMLTAMLTAVVRKLLPTAPAFGFDAPVQGSGKTLLLKVLCVLAGDTPTISPQPNATNDDEMRKRLFAMLREGKGALVIDNIVGAFDSPSLAAVVTSVSYSDRVLGESRSEVVPSLALVVVSGNNLTLEGDLPRRVLMTRIDPKVEKPHARSFGFDPEQVVQQYRQELVAAAITLMRAQMVRNPRVRLGEGRMASFEVWDDLVRQTICYLAAEQAAGRLPVGMQTDGRVFPALVDPMEATHDAVRSDPVRERLGTLLLEVAKTFGYGREGKMGPTFTVKQLVTASDPMRNSGLGSYIDVNDEDAALFEVLVSVAGHGTSRRVNNQSLAKYLTKHKDRIVGGLCLRKGESKQGYATWWIELDGGDDGGVGEVIDLARKTAADAERAKQERLERFKRLQQGHEGHKPVTGRTRKAD